ncbi:MULTISPECIES: hypothetical protein [Curtobacterium]|uniref:Uncharacterized protein n=1 Tax=Curtobacterium pusillum TaxID=69373 RepID=A0AAW3T2P8_9MICO|nr:MULTISPECIES: hypothetical protein [Curtobacterium]MBA8988862.1 hypothetical protein [Curtobacterium pusillum]MDY1006321.1 hypothetical protein [Curtobacterium sp. CFBP9011]
MTDSDTTMTRQEVLRRIPLANHAMVRRILEHIRISSFHQTTSYVRAEREDAKPPLRIASGWVNGFVDHDEAVAACGPGVTPWESDERRGLWGVGLPENSGRAGGSSGERRAEQQTCPTCGAIMPLTNVCDFCG